MKMNKWFCYLLCNMSVIINTMFLSDKLNEVKFDKN